MNTLLMILLGVFAGVALMVVIGERVAKPMDPEQVNKLSRWIMPLIGLIILLQAFFYFF